jgi:phosphohistidine phosphatase
MKTLLLIRHAKASMPNMNQSDFDRTLEKSGEADAQKMANKLFGANFSIDQIIASSANRTTQTAQIFATKNNIAFTEIAFKDNLYNAPAFVYEDVVYGLENNKNMVAIVGHNNGISEYASSLLKEKMYINMPPGSLVAFTAAIQSWEEFASADKELLFFEAP